MNPYSLTRDTESQFAPCGAGNPELEALAALGEVRSPDLQVQFDFTRSLDQQMVAAAMGANCSLLAIIEIQLHLIDGHGLIEQLHLGPFLR